MMFKLVVVVASVLLLALGLTTMISKAPQQSWKEKRAIESVARRAFAALRRPLCLKYPRSRFFQLELHLSRHIRTPLVDEGQRACGLRFVL